MILRVNPSFPPPPPFKAGRHHLPRVEI
jgi:hypothetical protein